MANKRVAILGSTGSIGRQALEVISRRSDISVCALAAGSNWRLLADQAERFHPEAVAIADDDAGDQLAGRLAGTTSPAPTLLSGPQAMTELVEKVRPDMLLNGVVGSAGLAPTLAAIACGAQPAIANKETLVMAGQVVMSAAGQAGLDVLPVDSEHSAIAQCLRAGRRQEVSRVVITASGGALRDWPDEQVATATVADALNHPTWEMGRKITIDSATLVNKALEVIEAHWLFDLPAERIEVVIHPESVVHSFVEFCDGSVIAQMGYPDMAMPIAYALSYPDRMPRPFRPIDLAELGQLTFSPCRGRFARAVGLGHEALRAGGLAGAVLNGANEAAVEAFLAGRIPFGQIVPIVEGLLRRTPPAENITVADVLRADAWARSQVETLLEIPDNQPSQG